VVLWPDTFTNYLTPEVGRAAVAVLESAGFAVELPSGPVCCGLTWISTGQLGVARRVASRSLHRLKPHLDAGALVVGLEPSCTAALRSDLPELLPGDETARLAERTRTLAELLTERGWEPPRRSGDALLQVHCHQRAVLGAAADEQLLARIGLAMHPLEPTCCGLAGNFGFERGHYEVAQAVGERVLLPAVRAASAETVLLADGFSCRTQIAHGTGRRARHLAELLAEGLHDRDRAGVTDGA
jgi:Fe-S oxidoreductase